MIKAVSLALFGLVLIVALLSGSKISQIRAMIDNGRSFTEPPTMVSTTNVINDEWENTLSSIGSLEAAEGLVITSTLSGRISKIHFNAGSEVKAGDLLVEQDTSSERAQLRSAKASAALAKTNLKRIEALYAKKVASKSEYDSAKSNYDSAVADADNILSSIEKKSIRAPFAGRLGIRLVNLGQTINAGEPVVSLQATNQMFVNFSLPQQHLSRVQANLPVRVTTDAIPNKQFEGKINAIDSEIDSQTRSITLQAILSNPGNELLPGMFVSIEVVLPEVSQVLLIPITAVQYATFGDSVFVIEPKTEESAKTAQMDEVSAQATLSNSEGALIARQQFVKLGQTRGDFVVVEKGLVLGQEIASIGVFKLRNGASVAINNNVVPEFSLNPAVVDQ